MMDVTLVQTSQDLGRILPENLDEISIRDITQNTNTSKLYCHGMLFCFVIIHFLPCTISIGPHFAPLLMFYTFYILKNEAFFVLLLYFLQNLDRCKL